VGGPQRLESALSQQRPDERTDQDQGYATYQAHIGRSAFDILLVIALAEVDEGVFVEDVAKPFHESISMRTQNRSPCIDEDHFSPMKR
jgi:hypothetical protein